MTYVLCTMILPFLGYILYEDWKEAAASRSQESSKART
jgi:hypothetical protein